MENQISKHEAQEFVKEHFELLKTITDGQIQIERKLDAVLKIFAAAAKSTGE